MDDKDKQRGKPLPPLPAIGIPSGLNTTLVRQSKRSPLMAIAGIICVVIIGVVTGAAVTVALWLVLSW